MLRALIIDDVSLARDRIRRCLQSVGDVEVAAECDNGERAVEAVHALAPDMIFLDVQMPAGDGFGVLEALGGGPVPAVIFVTAYDKYAIRAFEVNALDYLLKPVDCERLRRAVGRVRAQLSNREPGNELERFHALLEDLAPGARRLRRLSVKLTGRTLLLPADEIDWVETCGNHLRIHAGSEAHLIHDTLQSLEARLDTEKFVRIHRSTIVNVERVREVRPRSNGDQELVLQDGRRLMLSRNYRDRFFSMLHPRLTKTPGRLD